MMTLQHSRAMRNSYSLILSVALCLMFQGCEKIMPAEEQSFCGSVQELTAIVGGTGASGDGTMTSSASAGSMDDGGMTSQYGTRTSVDSDWNTSWTAGDALSVFVTRKSSSKYVGHSQYTYNGNDVFKGTQDNKFTSPYNWVAFYPYYNAGSTMSSLKLTVEHPQAQTQTGSSNSHISGANDPLYGYCLNTQTQPTIQMHHIAAAVRFRVKNCTAKPIKVLSINFTAPETITGKFNSQSITLSSFNGSLTWTKDSGSSKTVELTVSNGEVFGQNEMEYFYAAIHPIKARGSCTIVVRAVSEGKLLVFEKTITASLDFKAGSYSDINVNFANPTEDTSMYCIENDALKKYLDKVESTPYFTSNTFAGYSGNYTSTLMTEDIYGTNSSTNRLDQPKPVTIMWEGTATDVDVFDTESRTSALPNEVVLRSGEADVYNLIPGKKYWYTVSNGSSTVAEGEFVPEGRRRMMKVCSNYGATYAGNCRDLGGLPVMGGHSVKYGLIYRGTNLDSFKTNSEMRDVLLNVMGIKLDVDLRNHEQATSALNLTSYGIISDYQDYGYADLTDLQNPVKVKATLTAIMSSVLAGKPVYIHCKIGSDRTGYFCMLIEALLGVEQNWTDTDYELTSFASSITSGSRTRNRSGDNKYKDALNLFSGFNGTTLQDKVYDYVVTSKASKALQMDKATVDAFISAMVE